MKLAAWLKRNGVSDEKAGAALGVSRVTVSRLRRGKMVPSFDLAARINIYTGGKVPPDEWMELAIDAADDVQPFAEVRA